MPSLDAILSLLLTYTYWLIFPIAILEGPMIAVLTGWLVATNIVDPYISFVVLICADMCGDTLYYTLGRFGGNPFLKRWGHWVGVDDEKLLQLEEHFGNHAYKYLLFGKTQGFGGAILAAAGVVKMKFLPFIWINFLGSFPKVIMFLVIGYFFGQAYNQIDGYVTKIGLISFAIIAMVAVMYFFKKHAEKKA